MNQPARSKIYKVEKRIEVSGSHCLDLAYDSPCQNLHGHNWIIIVEVSGYHLNKNGMLIDFTHIKKVVMRLDHANINEVVGGINPTAENIAKWITDKVNVAIGQQDYDDGLDFEMRPWVSKVIVQESEGNIACYTQ